MADPDSRKLADLAYEQRYLERERERIAGFDPLADSGELGALRRNLLALLGLPAGAQVLDYGSGSCEVSEYLAVAGARPVALDMFPGYLQASRQRSATRGGAAPRYAVGDGERLPFRDGVFAGAVCSEVLHHVPDPSLGASEIFRTLAPGGVCLVIEPNALSPLRRVKELVIRRREHIMERSFYPWQLRRIFQRAGFHVQSLPISRYKVRSKHRGAVLGAMYALANGPVLWRVLNDTLLLARKPAAG